MMLLLLFAAAVVTSALFAGLETGIYTTSRLRLYLDHRAGVRAAGTVRSMLADMPALLAVLLLANNLANQAASFLAQLLLARWEFPSRELIGSLGVTLVLFLLAESVPKNAFLRRRERLLYPLLPVLLVARVLLAPAARPVAAVARLLERALRRRLSAGRARQPGGDSMLVTGADEGFLTAFQGQVAAGILGMKERTLADEAQPITRHPRARLGIAGLAIPAGSRDGQVLVLDAGGRECVGWLPMARLWTPSGFRAPAAGDLRPVLQARPGTSLDVIYARLDRSGSPFAVWATEGGLMVLDAERLRQRVMGGFAAGLATRA